MIKIIWFAMLAVVDMSLCLPALEPKAKVLAVLSLVLAFSAGCCLGEKLS